MIETLKLYLIRHAPVKKFEGYIPKKNPNAVINFEQLKKIASYIPSDSTCYVSPLKRAKQTAKALSKYVEFRKIIVEKKVLSFQKIKKFTTYQHLSESEISKY